LVNRGVNGRALFTTPREIAAFVAGLGNIATRFAVEIHAYCVMGNHYHLLARAEEEELLHALILLEADIPGRAGRARLCRLAAGRHLLQVTRYIHRNPVEAQIVKHPADWPWSSYRGYLDRLEAPSWLRSDAVLGWLGSIGSRQSYRRYVEADGARSNIATFQQGDEVH
jgi:REP element-mobilizing transposase RayT